MPAFVRYIGIDYSGAQTPTAYQLGKGHKGMTEPVNPALIERAIRFALDKHTGQVDKAGRPYILHPLRVMLQMDSDEAWLAALLHDILEDGQGVTLRDLKDLGLPPSVVEAIQVLTHPKDEPYEDYIARVAKHPLARKVKVADLKDNMNIQRLPAITDKDAARLDKYIRAYRTLVEADLN